MKTHLLIILAVSCLAFVTTNNCLAQADSASRGKLRKQGESASDQLKTDRQIANQLLLADTTYMIIEKGNNNLAFLATQLASKKDAKGIEKAFQDALTKDGILPMISDQDAMNLAKYAIKKRFPGSDKVVDIAAGYLEKLDADPGTPVKFENSDLQKIAVGALLQRFNELSTEDQNRVTAGLAKELGKNISDYEQKARDNRILSGTASSDGQPKDPNAAIDQKIYDEGIELAREKLRLSHEAARLLAENKKSEDLERLQTELASRVEHYGAAVFLGGVVLGPIVGDREAEKFSQAGGAFIKMYETMEKFGPGGLTPDKLLMCSNMVGAGMMLVQLFSQPKDPTMLALESIMKQLAEIKEMLDQIDKKIDALSGLVLVGFERILNNQQQLKLDFDNFFQIVVNNIQDTNKKEAITAYLNYLRSESSLYEQALNCVSTLPGDNPNGTFCLKELAADLSRRPIFLDPGSATAGSEIVPSILNSVWVNQMLSYGPLALGPTSNIDLIELSTPLYFLGNARASESLTARNHEAIAAYSSYRLSSAHPVTVPNPEILEKKLRLLVTSYQRVPEFRQSRAHELTDEALGRIAELENFLVATTGNEDNYIKVITLLSDRLNSYTTKVESLTAEILANPYSELKDRFLKRRLRPCSESNPNMQVLSPPANIETLVPAEYWAAEDAKMGKVEMCYQPAGTPLITSIGPFEFRKYQFRIKLTFQGPGDLDPTKIAAWEQETPQTRDSTQGMLIASRLAESKELFTNYNSGTEAGYYYIWYGTPKHALESYQCHKDGYPRTYPPSCQSISKVHEYFTKEAVEEADPATLTQNLDRVREAIGSTLQKIVNSRSQIWDPTRLQVRSYEVPPYLVNHPIQTVGFSDEMAEYEKVYALAQGLLLTASYHEATVSNCLAVLETFSPDSIAIIQKSVPWAPTRKASDLVTELSLEIPKCLTKGVRPDLAELKTKLTSIRTKQLRAK